jgi:hypothetical protein
MTMPESKTISDSPFSVDLCTHASKHIHFLQSLHAQGITLSQPCAESLRRYRDLWLPLVYEKSSPNNNGTEFNLIPPADLAWLWHCHRLAPLRYISFLKHRFGKDCPILEANPPFTFQLQGYDDSSESSFQLQAGGSSEYQTRDLWKQRYPEEPFEISLQSAKSGIEHAYENLCLNGFDLLGSTERQASFLWQVSAPRFQDKTFLDQGVDNYHRFLQLRKHAPSQTILVPTYQIDLMWHTHILTSMKAYQEDCLAIIGTALHHDDSLNDRTEGGALDTAFSATKVLWKEQYHEDYHVCGGMYRGEPPASFSHPEWSPLHDASKNDAPLGPFLKMIGVQGATSTNPMTTWTPINGVSPDGKPGFQSPAEKSGEKGVNANSAKEEYIFGKPTSTAGAVVGYYHSSTREFYEILLQRISKRVAHQESEIAMMRCTAGCLSCGTTNTSVNIQRQEAKLEELKDIQKIVLARSVADAPVGAAGAPKDLERNNARYSTWYGDGGEWNTPSDFYVAGGGELIFRFVRYRGTSSD